MIIRSLSCDEINMNEIFSYANYVELISMIKEKGSLCDFRDVNEALSSWIIMRHDVEFSPERAYKLSEIESRLDVSASYFFQLTNNAYNVLSKKNVEIMKAIIKNGSQVGLHFHLNGMTDIPKIKEKIQYEIEILSNVLNHKIDRFSFHRPSKIVLQNVIRIPGIINAYDPMYFTYIEDTKNFLIDSADIKYIADSRNEWSYVSPWLYPDKSFLEHYDKIQILCHPYSWTENGFGIKDNLKSMIQEKKQEFVNTMCSETNYVEGYKDEL